MVQIRKREGCRCRTLLFCGMRPTNAVAAFAILGITVLLCLQLPFIAKWHKETDVDGHSGMISSAEQDSATTGLISPLSMDRKATEQSVSGNAATSATASDAKQNRKAKTTVSVLTSAGGGPIQGSTLLKRAKKKQEARAPRAIPHILTFIYETNLLETKTPQLLYDNVQNTIDKYRTFWKEPDAPVRFLVDAADCRAEVEIAEPRLISHFDREEEGKLKAEVCRVAALYNSGGYYFDTDLRVIDAVHLTNATGFATVASPQGKTFFQAWLVSAPHHVVLKHALETILACYEGKQEIQGKNIGCNSLKVAFDSVDVSERGEVRLLRELKLKSPRIYPDLPRQEGKGCCCNYVVHDEFEGRVYFFSRIVGSSLYCEPP